MQHGDIIKKLSNWYFSKRVLPYWVIMLADAAIVFGCGVLTYWISSNSQITYEHHQDVFISALIYAAISFIGARMFRTYSGVLRYSSFVDLMKLTYANGLSMISALAVCLLGRWQGIDAISAISPIKTVVTFFLATFGMWALRILVKVLFDVANQDNHAINVLIYGAMTGGVGMAKYIRMQTPPQFKLKGFISHSSKLSGMRLMGVRVYPVDADFASIIKSGC